MSDNAENPTDQNQVELANEIEDYGDLVRDISSENWPQTVTILDFPPGTNSPSGKVFLVGTAHFSTESQADVRATIRRTLPDLVMVELCQSRTSFLTLDAETILRESQNLTTEKILATIKQTGVVQGLLHVLLLSMSAHITRELGMAPGGEFRAAYAESRKVPNCSFHLGDRPIQITLQRALGSLSVWQKCRLAFYILTSRQHITIEDVERCKQSDLLEEMLREMAGEFPALSEIFVRERDEFMSFGVKRLLAQSVTRRLDAIKSSGEPMVDNLPPIVLVGVVGIGHVPGIVANWQKETTNIRALMTVPPASLAGRVAKNVLRGSFLGLAGYLLYRGCRRFIR